MATKPDRVPWLVLAVLTLLLGVLGFLQYRWTHEIGRAAANIPRAYHIAPRSLRIRGWSGRSTILP